MDGMRCPHCGHAVAPKAVSLFEPPAPVAKPARPRDAMFDAIVELSGASPRAAGGRVGKLARLIEAEGITPEEFRRALPAVVAAYAPYRKALDLGTIEACWSWIRTPPRANGAAPAKAFKTRGEAEMDHVSGLVADTLAKRART